MVPLIVLSCLLKLSSLSFSVPLQSSDVIEQLYSGCLSEHTCYKNRNEALSCGCDSDCSKYGDCCINSTFRHSIKPSWKPMECINGFYIKTTCPSSWSNEEVKHHCETYQDASDPLATTPVVSLDSLVSYRNFYCAICNNDQKNIKLWDVEMTCRPPVNITLSESMKRRLRYDKKRSSWGIDYPRSKGSSNTFIPCHINNFPPIGKSGLIARNCIPTVSECSKDWTDARIRDKCRSYQGIIYVDYVAYRNPYCALCNKETINYANCNRLTYPNIANGFAGSGGGLGFHKIFQFNENDSEEKRCKEGEIEDPILNICHKLTCGFAHLEMKDGQCVPKR